ncbi:MAG TPA: head-tail connector protein [Patescibacteria group bacterium]|nr:head-tail connector protein [Patescibacteria group bacterium]
MTLIEDIPPSEPLTLEETKEHLRITHDADDDALAALIRTARQICEQHTGLALIARDCRMYLDAWPGTVIELPRPPLADVAAITLYDASGETSVFPATDYAVDTVGRPGRIRLTAAPPLPGAALNGIEIAFTAGYGEDASDVPSSLREGMKRLVAYLYLNRGDAPDTAIRNSGAGPLFAGYRVMRLA